MSGFRGAYLVAPRAGSRVLTDKAERRLARLAAGKQAYPRGKERALKKILDWTARRSGGRITITGKDPAGNTVKVPNVDVITGSKPPVAVDKDGNRYLLEAA